MKKQVIWFTSFLSNPSNIRSIRFQLKRGQKASSQDYVDYYQRYNGLEPIPRSETPEYIYFYIEKRASYKDNLPDIFMIQLGVIIISQAMHDLLSRFNLGQTLMHPIPLYEKDQVRQRPGQYYLLNIAKNRHCFVPEQSSGITLIEGTSFWLTDSDSESLAIRPEPAGDLDLWMDTSIQRRIFVSDRLKRAIKESAEGKPLRTRGMPFKRCIIV